jgi:hypothetical protein
MTPKEKANELLQKFLPEVRGADRYNYNTEDMNVYIAKKCALISIEEMLEESLSDEGFSFWHKVKKEIEKL